MATSVSRSPSATSSASTVYESDRTFASACSRASPYTCTPASSVRWQSSDRRFRGQTLRCGACGSLARSPGLVQGVAKRTRGVFADTPLWQCHTRNNPLRVCRTPGRAKPSTWWRGMVSSPKRVAGRPTRHSLPPRLPIHPRRHDLRPRALSPRASPSQQPIRRLPKVRCLVLIDIRSAGVGRCQMARRVVDGRRVTNLHPQLAVLHAVRQGSARLAGVVSSTHETRWCRGP